MASSRLTAALAAVVLGLPVAAHGQPAPCVGRYAVRSSRGPLIVSGSDFVALDAASAVVDPACGPAGLRTRRVRGLWRIDARWSACRERRAFRVRLVASADCTRLRGRATAPGTRPTRFVAGGSRCGDGIVDTGLGERCDDGNVVSGDACDAECGACTDPASLPSTWAAIQTNVFDRSCTSCHRDVATAGVDLRAPGTYERIVGVPSIGGGGLPLVAPGARTNSWLWLKMADGAIPGALDVAGAGMPYGSRLEPDVVDAVGRWIDAGAPLDGLVDGAEAVRPACE